MFLDLKLNPGEERNNWIFVLDLASIHRARCEFRAKVPRHVHSRVHPGPIDIILASPATWPCSRLGAQEMLPNLLKDVDEQTIFDLDEEDEQEKEVEEEEQPSE